MPPSADLDSDRRSRKISHRTRPSPSDDDAHAHRREKGCSASLDKRSDRRDYNVTAKFHRQRSRRDSSSPPPAKRRRSEERSRSPARRSRHHDRSRSPYRKDRKKENKKRRDESLSRSQSPPRRTTRDYSSSRSPPPRKYNHMRSPSPSSSPVKKSRKPLPSQEVSFRGELGPEDGALEKPIEKEKPNFKPTGLLAKESNTVSGTKIVLKYNEPAEARKPPPSQKWQLFVFKGDDVVEEIPLYTRSCWLIGREAAVADLLVEHPSCSKQHAVIQFRHSVKTNEFGDKKNIVRPYIIDLESANGTKLNGDKVKDSRYYEVRDKDLMKIGLSERDYVFMLPPS